LGFWGISNNLANHLSKYEGLKYIKMFDIFDPNLHNNWWPSITTTINFLKQFIEDSHALQHEIDKYSLFPPIFSSGSLEIFWKSHSNIYPNLSKLVQICLNIPSTTAVVERAFAKYRHVFREQRRRWTVEHLRQWIIWSINCKTTDLNNAKKSTDLQEEEKSESSNSEDSKEEEYSNSKNAFYEEMIE